MKKKRKKSKKTSQRDLDKITKRELLRRDKYYKKDLTEIMDNRRIIMYSQGYPKDIDGRDSKIINQDMEVNKNENFKGVPNQRFSNPNRSIVCRRREDRRRSLFALRKIGRGKGAGRKRRVMTRYSSISCKRR